MAPDTQAVFAAERSHHRYDQVIADSDTAGAAATPVDLHDRGSDRFHQRREFV
jgi:hypothetical protein